MQSYWQYREIGSLVVARAQQQRPQHNSQSSSDDRITEPDLDRDDLFIARDGKLDDQNPVNSFVDWDANDIYLSPRQWSRTKRTFAFILIWINCWAVDWPATGDSQTAGKLVEQFHQTEWAGALGPALYTMGIAVGALFAGPISETVGRNPIYIGSRIWNAIWLLVVALATNFGTYCAARFLAGTGGSIILAIHAASIADLYDPVDRSLAWPTVAMASFGSTMIAPVAGGWIANSKLNWRWSEWISLIISTTVLIVTILFLPETFSPILLKWKATHLRRETGLPYKSKLEQQSTLASRLRAAFARAASMFTREPIVILLGVWLVLVYIIVYGFLQSFAFIFGDTYGWHKGLVGTAFSAICVGVIVWYCSAPVYWWYYKRKVSHVKADFAGNGIDTEDKHIPGFDLPPPEYRLWTALPVAPALPLSMFWMGWTNYVTISPWSNLGAATLFGICWAGIYVTVYNYILDVYGIYAGSALAMITFFRYMASAGISLVARPMYDGIGVHWALTLLGIVAAVTAPIPLLLAKYGPYLRANSRFASEYAKQVQEEHMAKASSSKSESKAI